MKAEQNSTNPTDRPDQKKSRVFSDVIIENNKRLLIAFLIIAGFANVAVTLIKIAGIGSQYLEFHHIIIEVIVVAVTLAVSYFLSNRFRGEIASGYILITGVLICISVFEYAFHGSKQLFATRYIPLALSIFYFHPPITIYTLVLVLISQALVMIINPDLRLPPPYSDTAVRFILYAMSGVAAFFGARASMRLLNFAIYQHEEANSSLVNLREMAGAVVKSVDIMKQETSEHEVITKDMNDISQHQAASLEEITTALEELASNSNAISEIARSLYEELDITVESVNDLKAVNDKVQESSTEMNRALREVTTHSESTAEQIRHTEEKFNTVKTRSGEMANFVQVINDIADKVNLLSLNAAIEAARAGEYGRGFAVVADEISKLAEATSVNSKEIENIIKENLRLIEESGGLIKQSVETMTKLNTAIQSIRGEVTEVGNLINDIGVTIKTIKNLNVKIHESSKTIENSTSEQKIATDESTRTAFDIAQKSQEIVNIAIKLSRSTRTIREITEELDRVTNEMVK
ncbi:MAG: chemotaxis protein [Spirochaetes bacterium]|nr:chemotaxis protein [Spirochaetota bacterium]